MMVYTINDYLLAQIELNVFFFSTCVSVFINVYVLLTREENG